jgi:LmbE family N-acetylglucosaminyl deacetylase
VLVVAPHPDDDLIGCGGSIAKHLSQGVEVSVVYVTNGDAENLNYPKEEFTELRRRETIKAAGAIGLRPGNLIFLREAVWEINQDRTRRSLLRIVREWKPDVCYIPHANDAHVDHRIVHHIAEDAINMASSPWFKEYGTQEDSWTVSTVLCYEVWTPLVEISYTEDITDFIDEKLGALLKHESQIAERRYDEAVKGLNRYRGAMIGNGKYCEVFQLIKTAKAF